MCCLICRQMNSDEEYNRFRGQLNKFIHVYNEMLLQQSSWIKRTGLHIQEAVPRRISIWIVRLLSLIYLLATCLSSLSKGPSTFRWHELVSFVLQSVGNLFAGIQILCAQYLSST